MLSEGQARYQETWVLSYMQETGCKFEQAYDKYIEVHHFRPPFPLDPNYLD